MSDLYEKTHLETNALRIVHLRRALQEIIAQLNVEDEWRNHPLTAIEVARDAIHNDDVTVDIAENGPAHDPSDWESEITGREW